MTSRIGMRHSFIFLSGVACGLSITRGLFGYEKTALLLVVLSVVILALTELVLRNKVGK